MTFILKTKKIICKNDTLIFIKTLITISLFIVIAMLFIKYKPAYKVTLDGEKIGYVENVNEFNTLIEEKIINTDEENVAYTTLNKEPEYKLEFVARTNITDTATMIDEIKSKDTTIMYKYYEVAVNNETKTYVDTLEEACKIVDDMKAEFSDDNNLDFQINEKYTENLDEITTDAVETATNTIEVAASKIEERNNAIAVVNDVNFAYLPVSGRITSRYGESSSIRSSRHTGLDIACSYGTPIKVVSGGTVIFAGESGSYGNLVKIQHENGVETWYGHCSKIFVKEGQNVLAGDEIAAVGSTGNSTGPHLHFEIRINGETINPQNYVY